MGNLPRRNQVLIIGDFNSRLATEGSLVGRGTPQTSSAHASDNHMLQDLLKNPFSGSP